MVVRRSQLASADGTSMTGKTNWWSSWEITIDSNWIMTIGMTLLVAFIAYRLGLSILDLLFDKVDYQVSESVRNGWLDALAPVIGAVYSFMFAYSFPGKDLKVAFLLLGTEYTVRFTLVYLHVAAGIHHSAAVAGSIARQVAFTIILVAIIRWFRSVVRWIPPSNAGADY
jgi:hypothetical protein